MEQTCYHFVAVIISENQSNTHVNNNNTNCIMPIYHLLLFNHKSGFPRPLLLEIFF